MMDSWLAPISAPVDEPMAVIRLAAEGVEGEGDDEAQEARHDH